MSLLSNPAIALRLEFLEGKLSDTTFASGDTKVGPELAATARSILTSVPATADVGRVIAFLDSLITAQSILVSGVAIGVAADVRKKRKAEDEKPAAQKD